MPRKSKKVEMDTNRDDLADMLALELNKANKDGGNVAFVLGDDLDDDPSKIIDWVPSGNDQLDIIMANRGEAGYPVGRITELTGLEGSGKTLLSMHALAETQKKGGLAVFIDTESSLDINFVKAIGVDPNKMLYISCDMVEEIFDHMEMIVEKIRKANKNKLVTIVVDSVAAASCKTEMEADHGKDGYATAKAIIISKAMRKITQMIARQRICLIFTNQLRVKMNAMFGDPYTTSGGKALAFHASLRLRLQAVGQIKDAKKNTIGIKTRAKIVKNRMGPPMRNIDFDLFYDRGLDNYGNWLDTLKENKVIAGTRTPYDYTKDNGDVVKIPKAELTQLLDGDKDLRDELYSKLCDIHIMKYKDQSQCEADDIEYDDSVEAPAE
jgi:recombination protein RecA